MEKPINKSQEEIDALVNDNINLAKWIACKHLNYAKERGVDFDTIFQEGCIGLILAAQRYDSTRGEFATFAVPYISGYIRRSLGMRNKGNNLEKTSKGALSLMYRPGIISSDENELNIIYNDDISKLIVDEYLSSLKYRDRQIIEMRMQGKNQKEIANKFGLKQCTISRILTELANDIKNKKIF